MDARHDDPRTPRQQFEDLFRPPARDMTLYLGGLWEHDPQYPLRSRRLPPGEERERLRELR